MSNWCHNHLRIRGNEKEIAEFKKQAEGIDYYGDQSHFCFEKLSPFPPGLKITDEKWDDWTGLNWGTNKSSDCSELNIDNKDELGYFFFTAWSPSINLFLNISSKYPNLIFKLNYNCALSDFEGWIVIQNGFIRDEKHGQYEWE